MYELTSIKILIGKFSTRLETIGLKTDLRKFFHIQYWEVEMNKVRERAVKKKQVYEIIIVIKYTERDTEFTWENEKEIMVENSPGSMKDMDPWIV